MMKERKSSNTHLKMSLPENFLRQIQVQKQQLMKIRQQQQTILSIDDNLRKKNQQILRLKTLVDKFQPYYKKYNNLSCQFTQKCARLNQKQMQFNMLLKQTDDLLRQYDSIQHKFQLCEKQRSRLTKQQHQIEKVNQQIEQTFKLYQEECKTKQMGLLRDLQKAYKQVTELNKRLDQYQMKLFQNQELKRKLISKVQKQNKLRQPLQSDISHISAINNKHMLESKQQIESLKVILSNKEDQLTKYKVLNQELSIQFDKSVNKICQFQRQLTKYRQQNHQLQKMLSLFVQKEKYQKMHIRQVQKANYRKKYENSAQQNLSNQRNRINRHNSDSEQVNEHQ